MDWLKGRKTYLTSVLMLFISFLNFSTGNISLHEFVSSDSMTWVLEAVGLSTLRAAIKNNQEEVIHEVVKKVNFPHS